MARRRPSEKHIFFPWERRGGLIRRIRVDQVRAFFALVVALSVVALIGVRERRASGIRRTRATMLSVREAVDSYMADHDGGCPRAGLSAVTDYSPTEAAEGPPRDAWGKPLRLVCPGSDR